MSPAIRVFLADDQALVRSGFRMLIESEDDLVVVGEASDGAATLRALSAQPVDVVLMDIRMPVMDGVEATRLIVQSGLPTRVLVLTTFDLDEYVFAALKAGASGFLLKDATPAMLREAIHTVYAGNAVLAPADLAVLLDGQFRARKALPPGFDTLTEREREVLDAVARGLSNAEIAQAMFASESTVKTHLGAVLRKLGLRDRVQVVVFAHEHGLTS